MVIEIQFNFQIYEQCAEKAFPKNHNQYPMKS